MFEILEQSYLGDLVDTYPMASKVFAKYGLDFCCRGQRSLATACIQSNVEKKEVLEELIAIKDSTPTQLWSSASNKELIQHILDHYHAPLYENIPCLENLLTKVVKTHSTKGCEYLNALRAVFFSFSKDLTAHMAKEEQILFPWILSNEDSSPSAPIQCMLVEHERTGRSLEHMSVLTNGFKAPKHACTAWRSLYVELESLCFQMRMHIHIENNILFPRFV
ncbi:MAG: iron-sulfur cluster repair di-iron protein [SAR86 cluster bacterium]|jgi:regulator of cell morphogenesis and NO signaling|nr:iron-sulfur cluster repair di-iron protein [SAR86 cluster bacterium]